MIGVWRKLDGRQRDLPEKENLSGSSRRRGDVGTSKLEAERLGPSENLSIHVRRDPHGHVRGD